MNTRNLLLAATLITTVAMPALAQTSAPTNAMTSSGNAMSSDAFYTGTWMPTYWNSSEVIGQPVYNTQNERIGEIQELISDADGKILAAVIGVGGFLGMGEHDVAVNYKALRMTRDDKGKAKLTANLDKAQLQKAPEYKKPDHSKK